MLTWSCLSAETQPSPSESIEPEREELASVSKDAPMQVKSLELGKCSVSSGAFFSWAVLALPPGSRVHGFGWHPCKHFPLPLLLHSSDPFG